LNEWSLLFNQTTRANHPFTTPLKLDEQGVTNICIYEFLGMAKRQKYTKKQESGAKVFPNSFTQQDINRIYKLDRNVSCRFDTKLSITRFGETD
jgi:hypothetical protein